jgi:hypothetical protein
MFIPVVRRTVTVRARDTFHFPFRCDFCQLQTWAHVTGEGTGSASMAYLSPDAEAARQRAYSSAQHMAGSLFAQSPCPRCGANSAAQRGSLQAWETKAAGRKQVRFWAMMIGFGFTLLSAAGCTTIVAMGDDDGSVGAGIILGFGWMFLGAMMTLILYAILGPGKRPVLLNYIPQGVYFDPPDPASVQGGYRTG